MTKILFVCHGNICRSPMAEYVMREVTGLPMQSIGDEFGARDHSTIVYAVRKVEERMEKDSVFKNTVNDIIKNISEG